MCRVVTQWAAISIRKGYKCSASCNYTNEKESELYLTSHLQSCGCNITTKLQSAYCECLNLDCGFNLYTNQHFTYFCPEKNHSRKIWHQIWTDLSIASIWQTSASTVKQKNMYTISDNYEKYTLHFNLHSFNSHFNEIRIWDLSITDTRSWMCSLQYINRKYKAGSFLSGSPDKLGLWWWRRKTCTG